MQRLKSNTKLTQDFMENESFKNGENTRTSSRDRNNTPNTKSSSANMNNNNTKSITKEKVISQIMQKGVLKPQFRINQKPKIE